MSNKSLTPAMAIKQQLTRLRDEFKAALPSHIDVDRFLRTLQTAVSSNPSLIEANRKSLFEASMKSAQDGLLPDGREAAIVTFRGKGGETIATYMPMIAGILKKIRNSGELSTITSHIIYANDDFKFFIDEHGEHIEHTPHMLGDRGKPLGVYALARTKDGGVYVEVMSASQVEDVKSVSRGKNGPWSGPFETEMWRKTAIRRLSKRLPMSTDLEMTIRADDDLYELDKPGHAAEIEVSEADDASEEKIDKSVPHRLEKLVNQDAADEVEKVYEKSETEATPKNYAPGVRELSDDEVPV